MYQQNGNLSVKARQALFLASQSMYVFPLQPGKRIPVGGCAKCRVGALRMHRAEDCLCIPDGMYCHGAHAATNDFNTIKRWWSMPRNTNAGIGINLGKSGLIMLDIDSHKDERVPAERAIPGVLPTISAGLTAADGWDSMAFLAGERNQPDPWLEPGIQVVTPSGGLHIWYRVQDPELYKNIDGKLAWQVDVKAGPAFAVAPGTVITDDQGNFKGSYSPLRDSTWGDGPAPLPAWLDAEIRRVGGLKVSVKASDRQRLKDRLKAAQRPSQAPSAEFVELVMSEALEAVQSAPGGQRNAALNAAAFKVGRALVSRDETLREALAERLEEAAMAGGTPAYEARATVASGLAGGIKAAASRRS